MADNIQHWLGETYYVTQNTTMRRLVFQRRMAAARRDAMPKLPSRAEKGGCRSRRWNSSSNDFRTATRQAGADASANTAQ
jgi:hypothetical protein